MNPNFFNNVEYMGENICVLKFYILETKDIGHQNVITKWTRMINH